MNEGADEIRQVFILFLYNPRKGDPTHDGAHRKVRFHQLQVIKSEAFAKQLDLNTSVITVDIIF